MPRWTVRLSEPGENDFGDILTYTAENFGARQGKTYQTTLKAALNALTSGQIVDRSVARDDLGTGLRTLHVARRRRRGRHLTLYREGADHTIEVLRILHDTMDLGRHISK